MHFTFCLLDSCVHTSVRFSEAFSHVTSTAHRLFTHTSTDSPVHGKPSTEATVTRFEPRGDAQLSWSTSERSVHRQRRLSHVDTISTFLCTSLQRHVPILSVFSHVSCHFMFVHIFPGVVESPPSRPAPFSRPREPFLSFFLRCCLLLF